MSKITFLNDAGIELAARLERPAGAVRTWAVFAHCFTCSKDFIAAARISRALQERGIGVLRFDFTGLGNSQGDFANTNFSSNIEDLISAVNFMDSQGHTVELLIGHSLGGAAVLAAAGRLETVKAVVTIAAPAGPSYLKRHLVDQLDLIQQQGFATINIAGRKFTIKKQFLDDLDHPRHQLAIKNLNRPLLIYHSPSDNIVGIEDALKIFQAAGHPKSLISLAGADHLLTRKEDSQYVAETLVAWLGKYL